MHGAPPRRSRTGAPGERGESSPRSLRISSSQQRIHLRGRSRRRRPLRQRQTLASSTFLLGNRVIRIVYPIGISSKRSANIRGTATGQQKSAGDHKSVHHLCSFFHGGVPEVSTLPLIIDYGVILSASGGENPVSGLRICTSRPQGRRSLPGWVAGVI